MSNERSTQLAALLQAGNTDGAVALIKTTQSYNEGESFVFAALKADEQPATLLEAALEAFMETSKVNNYCPKHGYWVHSLSHFTDKLWQRGMFDWIKRFNEVAFRGAIEYCDDNCSDRLVSDFCRFSKWSDDPADFHLTPANTAWLDPKYSGYAIARIAAGKFESEVEYIRFKLCRPETRKAFDYDAQMDLVNVKGIRGLIQQLAELGADTSEFATLEVDLLTAHLSELEHHLSSPLKDWQQERVEKAIVKTKEALGQ